MRTKNYEFLMERLSETSSSEEILLELGTPGGLAGSFQSRPGTAASQVGRGVAGTFNAIGRGLKHAGQFAYNPYTKTMDTAKKIGNTISNAVNNLGADSVPGLSAWAPFVDNINSWYEDVKRGRQYIVVNSYDNGQTTKAAIFTGVTLSVVGRGNARSIDGIKLEFNMLPLSSSDNDLREYSKYNPPQGGNTVLDQSVPGTPVSATIHATDVSDISLHRQVASLYPQNRQQIDYNLQSLLERTFDFNNLPRRRQTNTTSTSANAVGWTISIINLNRSLNPFI